MDGEDSWLLWSKFVLAELKRLNQEIAKLEEEISRLRVDQISKLRIDIAMLQVKSGVWGCIGGLIPIIILITIEILKK